MKRMNFTRNICLLLAVLLAFSPIFSSNLFGFEAEALTYRTGANGPAATYKASKYYTHATSIELTGDGVTDTLSLALSQLGYYEGTSSNPYSGLYNTNTEYTTNKTTEYVYNYGDADSSGYKMAWCASFCSWAIFQAGVTNHSTHADSCRNHIGDKNYIWRECSCYQWADQLKRFSMYYARGSYTPKAGDLIFFKMDGGGTAWTNHIGLVLYSDGSRVYTVEGNRKNHVDLFNYSLSDSQICGYGVLPYPSDSSVKKVDYTGVNKTAGKYITNNTTLAVSSSKGGSTAFSVGKYEMFEVTGFDGGYAMVSYGGKTGYATLSSTTIQVTATNEVVETMNASLVATSGKTSGYMGGSKLPDSNNNFQNPNFLIEGLREDTSNYKGLENYGTNKEKIIINGRTLSKWESREGTPIINNIWVYSAGDGKAYLGIDIADSTRLRVKGRDGIGEEIESIVIKRGFEIVKTTSDRWTAGEIATGGTGVGEVVGVFKENVVLTAVDNTYFTVTLGGSNSLGLDGLNFQSAASQVVKITYGTNIRLEPNTEATALGFGNPGETYEYLGEVRNSKWYMVDYKGHVCWISSDSASLVSAPQYVTLTADANIRSGADTTYSVLGVGTAGSSYEYLNEIQNTKWLKVSYNGGVGWISNVNATLSAASSVVTVTAENKDWVKPSMDASITITDGTTYVYWGGSKLPDSNNNFQNPNLLVSGLNGNTNNYKGLENYGTNKDKIIINGRTLSKWESREGGPVINNVWVYSAGDGKAYLGIDIADTSKLRVKGRDGTGEEIESIVIKRGFEIVSTSSDRWSLGEISTDNVNVSGVVGVFKENVVLTAKDNVTFNATMGGSNSLGIEGVTFSTATPQLVSVTTALNVRSAPNMDATQFGSAPVGSTYEYLNEIRNSKWYMVDYNGKVGWIPQDNASLITDTTASNLVLATAANNDWEEITLSTINGAQIRTSGSQGLRFISTIEKNEAFEDVVEYGTVLILSADITDISQLKIGATLNGHTVAKVPANAIYSETDDSITFTAVLTNIANKYLTREYTARAYAILKDGSVVYSDTGASRSVYGVAKAGLEAGRESESVLEIFRNIIKTAESYGDNDVSWQW